MRSKEIADLAGVSVRALRHYRKIGLLREPSRSANGYCDYTIDDLVRLLRIKSLASLGFSLEDTASMLDQDDDSTIASPYDQKLEQLDHELTAQIARLEEQRRVIARLRAESISPDMPLRGGRVMRKLSDTKLVANMEKIEKTSLLLAAHLYADEDFDEIDNFCSALIERDLVDEYQRASERLENLEESATEQDLEQAANEMIVLLTKVIDCFDIKNWDRPTTNAEKIIDEYSQGTLNAAQELVANRILETVYERIVEREQVDRR